jgi:O-methyltransferase involved in polyketide biosynthesis
MMPESGASLGRVTTALTAAAARAAHLIVDRPPYLFADPLAAPLLGDRRRPAVRDTRRRARFLRVPLAAGRQGTAGFDPAAPAVVSWLGVTMYLSRPAVEDTVATLGGFAPGTELILDYLVPAGLRDADGGTYVDLVGPVTAERGEPWLTFPSPDEAAGILTAQGFHGIRHAEQRTMVDPALWTRDDALTPSNLARIVHGSR